MSFVAKSLDTLSQMSSPAETPLVALMLSPIAWAAKLGRYQPRLVKG